MTTPNVVLLSLWRNDQHRRLAERARHLLAKTYQNLRWLWLVVDSEDETFEGLCQIAALAEEARGLGEAPRAVQILHGQTFIRGEERTTRLQRLATTANLGLLEVNGWDQLVCVHESDLVSPPDVVERLVAVHTAKGGGVAGWPTITLAGRQIFYDIWAYRGLDGRLFTAEPPYHKWYLADQVFQVGSFGSVYLYPADLVRQGLRYGPKAVVSLCERMREMGEHLWVDPTLAITQPVDLWQAHTVVP